MEPELKIALYQPDIAGNVGTILRLGACMGVTCAIIEPCGFPFSDKALKRAGMDYAAAADVERFGDWSGFAGQARDEGRRIVLMSSKGASPLYEAEFRADDILLFGDVSQYRIVDRVGLVMLYNPMVMGSANQRPTGQAGWFGYWRVGADVQTSNGFRLLKI